MFCISVSYKKAPAKVRGQFSFDHEERERLVSALMDSEDVNGCAVLCTCNRNEIYLSGSRYAVEALQDQVGQMKGIPGQKLLKYLNIYSGDKAAAHLFKVCCGFDSMVLGEDEILGQVKAAYQEALSMGSADYELNALFKRAITCAKRIKTDTKISSTPLSVATLVANQIFRFEKEGVKEVMLIGITGKMGNTIAKNILSKPGIRVTGTVRSHNSELCLDLKEDGIRLVNYKDRYRYAGEMDMIISATTSPHYTITGDELQKALGSDGNWNGDLKAIGKTPLRERLLIDLAVPLDIDPEAAGIPGVCLYDIDYFEQLSINNRQLRLRELDLAEAIMEEDLDAALKELMFRPYIGRLKELKEALSGKELDTLLFQVRDHVSSQDLKVILKTLDGLERWVSEGAAADG